MYLTDIEEFYNQRRGRGLILSTKDWQLACRWQEQGIPLNVVLRGIERALSQADSSKQIRSLAYCDQEIHRLFKENIALMAGSLPEGEEKQAEQVPYVTAQLEELKTDVNASMMLGNDAALMEKLQQVYLQIQDLQQNQADDWLLIVKQITNNLIVDLQQQLSAGKAAELKSAAQKHLKGYETRMSREAYQKTLDILTREQLLAQFNLEAFSLYAG